VPFRPDEYVGVAAPHDWWLRVDLDQHWTVAYRLAVKAGQPIVAEMRLFPFEADSRMGEWSGQFLGVAAHVPGRGITASLLRQITPGNHLRQLPAIMRATMQRSWFTYAEEQGKIIRRPAPSELLFSKRGFFGASDFQAPKLRGSKVGRPGRSDTFLALIAAEYTRTIAIGSQRPIKDVAREFRQPESAVRNWIYQARERRLLKGRQWGQRGGELTKRARMLLDSALQSFATHASPEVPPSPSDESS